MKRFLILLLIALLPLQMSWAAVNGACGPDSGKSSSAPHTHEAHPGGAGEHGLHHGMVVDVQDTAASDGGQCERDCGTCHIGCCTPLASQVSLMTLSTHDTAPDSFTSLLLPSPASQRPERPKWLSLA